MNWDDGLSKDGSRIVTCGLSYLQITSCAGMSQKEAAKRLGVDYAGFNQHMVRLGASHWFSQKRPRKVKKRSVVRLAREGYLQKDAAHLLGVSYGHLNLKVKEWGLRGMFPANGGEAIWKGRRGYAE